MEALEREITREQAQLLFSLPDDGIKTYQLVLIPTPGDAGEEQVAAPFETEQELTEFVRNANQKWLTYETW
ncbi:MAG: hypothetical protein LBS98_00075 [Coriobacteriales bacterium]|nr:hypothetical protein [Coriobacteriales bacterium]